MRADTGPVEEVFQVELGAWERSLVDPVWLCSLPYSAAEFSRRTGIRFSRAGEQGLGGETLRAACRVDGYSVLFECLLEGPATVELVSVLVPATDLAWKEALDAVVARLRLRIEDLPRLAGPESLKVWELWRLDDNGNEVQMHELLSKSRAEQARDVYAARGHKQTYFVRYAGALQS